MVCVGGRGWSTQYRHRLLLLNPSIKHHKTRAQRMRGDGLTYSQLGVNGHISFFAEVQRRCVIFLGGRYVDI